MAKQYKPETVRAAFSQWFIGEESAEGEQKAYCPLCEDPETSNSASASFNPELGKWNCLKSRHGGSITDLAKRLKEQDGWDIRRAAMAVRNKDSDFVKRRDAGLVAAGRKAAPLPDKKQINKWHRALMTDERVRGYLQKKRGLSTTTLKRAKIGWNGRRYTIPVYDAEGALINVRQYKPGVTDSKVLNLPGHGAVALYGISDIARFDIIVVVEGEIDRLLLRQELHENGLDDIGVVTSTAGARTFKPAWASLFNGKTVYTCYDCDEAGRKGSARVIAILQNHADAAYNVVLPLADKGADVSDYLLHHGSANDFRQLMKQAESDEHEALAPPATKGKRMSLQESMSEDNQGETMELVVSVSGKQQEPFTAPKRITATCDMSKGPVCSVCPVGLANGELSKDIRPDDKNLFRFVDSGEGRRQKLLREIIGAKCSDRVEIEAPEMYNVEELLVQPSIDDRKDDETQQPIRRTVFSVGTHKTGVNEKVKFVGTNTSDPKSGRLRFMAWQNKRVETDIDKFNMTQDIYSRLTIFRESDDQSPLDKCIEIAKDMADNVTHIYDRDLLHVSYDLVYHSVLGFNIGDTAEDKGWLEMMVVGDTRTGKSEVAKQLLRHYRSGEMLSCEGVTFAGIVGGVQQIDGRWHMTWGVVPMNDRRLVILDEVSGMSESNIIERMSSIRSSGVAQITKIATEQTSARTRLIWITNPANGGNLNDSPKMGVAAMQSVVPNNEDVARFDFVTAAAKGEVSDSLINSAGSEVSRPEYPSEECELLIKWAWSLTKKKIHISEKAVVEMYRLATKLGKEYVPDPPLIQSENVRFKLMRIACAIAARTFSATESGDLIVRAEHVKDAERFLQMAYSHDALGYKRLSQHRIHENKIAEENKSGVLAWLKSNEQDDLLQALLTIGAESFRHIDIENYGQMDRDRSQAYVKALQARYMLKRLNSGKMKLTAPMLAVLREIEDES